MTLTVFCLSTRCKFEGGLPSIVFRGHEGGRIQLWLAGNWIATVIPGKLMGQDCEAVLLSNNGPESIEIEWRGSIGAIAAGISELQQTADWFAADDAFAAASEFDQLFVE